MAGAAKSTAARHANNRFLKLRTCRPLGWTALAFFGQGAWQERSGGWWTALAVAGVVLVEVIVLSGVYWLNQYAVRSELEPRRRELETLLVSLEDEAPDAS